jgi:hypothetical protein
MTARRYRNPWANLILLRQTPKDAKKRIIDSFRLRKTPQV